MGLRRLNRKERQIWNGIEAGNKVTISLKKGEREKYNSTVLEVGDANIYVKTPVVGEIYLDFFRNTPVEAELEVHTPQSGRIKFISKIVGQEWLKENCIKIACPRKIRWIQLRRHYRIEAELPAEFSFVKKNKPSGDLHVESPLLSTTVKNVSEGGASLVLDKIESIQVNSLINIKIHLLPHSLVRARAKIVHIEFAMGKCGLGIEWVMMERKSREDLRRFILANLKNKI